MGRDARLERETPQGGQATRPRWGDDRHRDPVAAYLAERQGGSPHTIEHRIRAANHETAAQVEAMLELGAVERAYEHARPVLTALERIQALPVKDVLQPATDADAFEESPESAYRLNPCHATRRAWLPRLKRQLVTTLQLIASLEHEDATDVAALA